MEAMHDIREGRFSSKYNSPWGGEGGGFNPGPMIQKHTNVSTVSSAAAAIIDDGSCKTDTREEEEDVSRVNFAWYVMFKITVASGI